MIQRVFKVPVLNNRSCRGGELPGRKPYLLSVSSVFLLSSPRNRFGCSRGLTLIELLVVIILLGLMFSFTIPNFRESMLTDSLDATSLNIIGLVQDLREKAIADQISYNLYFDIPEKKIWALGANADEEEREQAREQAVTLRDDVAIQDVWSWRNGKQYDEAVIRFSRKGYVEQAIIHLQSEDGKELSLEFSPFLGSVEIHEGYVDRING